MGDVSFFFAGGGTGGHIYPGLAVAEQIAAQRSDAHIHFLCSTRPIDKRILDTTIFPYTTLLATGLYFDPKRLLRFGSTFRHSYRQARAIISGTPNAAVIGAGGFVAAPVCLAGRRLGVPVAVVNIDIVAGRANRLSARWADEIFLQFEEASRQFGQRRVPVTVVGCPLRRGFADPQPRRAVADIGLEKDKKVLLITGASSGSAHINEAVGMLLGRLERFADTWQIVHLTGLDNHEAVAARYEDARISHQVLDYYDGMADLL
ncbi:MAG: UDP-N-acetylglucosamine--N-acetylmuramyl-(pentapeptide) pyrophosphoryl-undecaprenol N-acetylglucosamine transferase, partial [Sedimentisphaerales bacterium]|nr:UDP-N-acetylglucosamine--N-acetylmuramyl-(pentapeptide) pyrophosphoryl-undecaprenol N-acetylglucosamine transferase [Sedimentisphaerales bacterium]